jgi:hypothetical protein
MNTPSAFRRMVPRTDALFNYRCDHVRTVGSAASPPSPIVYPRLTDDVAIVENGFQLRQSCRLSGAFVARNLETSGTTIRRLEISRASTTIQAIGSIWRSSGPLRFAQSADADRVQSRGCPFGPASGSDPGLVHNPFFKL